jgi:hypothetical protein
MSMLRLDERSSAIAEMLRYLVDFPFTVLVWCVFVCVCVCLCVFVCVCVCVAFCLHDHISFSIEPSVLPERHVRVRRAWHLGRAVRRVAIIALLWDGVLR